MPLDETQVQEPAVGVAEPEVAPAPVTETPPTEPPVETPPEEPTYESARDGLLTNEKYRTAYDAEIETARQDGSKKLFETLDPRLAEAEQQTARATALYGEVKEGLATLHGAWRKAQDEGDASDERFLGILQSDRRIWDAFQAIGAQVQQVKETTGLQRGQALGGLNAARFIITRGFQHVGKPDLVAQFTPRLQAGEDANKVVDDYADALIDIGFKKGLAKRQGTSVEGEKVEARKSEGPDMVPKGGGDNRSEDAILADSKTPVSTLMEIRERQRAAGE